MKRFKVLSAFREAVFHTTIPIIEKIFVFIRFIRTLSAEGGICVPDVVLPRATKYYPPLRVVGDYCGDRISTDIKPRRGFAAIQNRVLQAAKSFHTTIPIIEKIFVFIRFIRLIRAAKIRVNPKNPRYQRF